MLIEPPPIRKRKLETGYSPKPARRLRKTLVAEVSPSPSVVPVTESPKGLGAKPSKADFR